MGDNTGTSAAKRSCRKCRQQKLRCDVIQNPFTACSRCRRSGKECIIDADSKHRGKYTHLRREIDNLREQLRQTTERQNVHPGTATERLISDPLPANPSFVEDIVTAETSHASSAHSWPRRIGTIVVPGKTLDALYKIYFTFHHFFIPLLDPYSTPDDYFSLSELLGWTVVMVAARRYPEDPNLLETLREDYVKLMWSKIADQRQSYHIVKAFCLLCYWPLPTSKDMFEDPSWQISGIMMNSALLNLLHFSIQTMPRQRDRVITWVFCNIVAQSMSNICGLPLQNYHAGSLVDYEHLQPFNLPENIIHQLRISQFCDSVSQTLYCPSDPQRLLSMEVRAESLRQLKTVYMSLHQTVGSVTSGFTQLHLLAAKLHLNVFALFLPSSSLDRELALSDLFDAACEYIEKVLDFEVSTGTLLEHCSNFISQTMFSALFALLRLLQIRFAFDMARAKANFNGALLAARRISSRQNDLASRIATRAPLLWQRWAEDVQGTPSESSSSMLKIQTRMSVSHIYDCIWEWRQAFQSRVDITASDEASDSAVAKSFEPLLSRPDANLSTGNPFDHLSDTLAWQDWINFEQMLSPLDWDDT